jgi:hypothetical protein
VGDVLFAYTVVAASAGLAFWLYTGHTPQEDRNKGWDTRRAFLTIAIGICWPSVILLVVAWQFPQGRDLITRYLTGADSGDPDTR